MKIIFVCVGTPKIKGDSIGPKVGSFLEELGYVVYGTIREPITSLNVQDIMQILKKDHSEDIVVAIDAAFGDKEDIGKIKYSLDGIRPGGAYSRKNIKFGDIGLLAIVADRNSKRSTALQLVEDKIIDKLLKEMIELSEYINHTFGKKIIKKYFKNQVNI